MFKAVEVLKMEGSRITGKTLEEDSSLKEQTDPARLFKDALKGTGSCRISLRPSPRTTRTFRGCNELHKRWSSPPDRTYSP